MRLNKVIPLENKEKNITRRENESPFFALQHRMNRIFDDFLGEPFDLFGQGSYMPQMNVSEDEKEIMVTAELPGVEEKDLDVSISKDALTIKGEKKTEIEDKNKDYYRVERSYGSFSRTLPMPEGIDEAKAQAELKKGVLKIRIPKSAQAAPQRKKIEVKGE